MKDEVYLYSLAGERLKRLAPDFVGAASVAGQRDKSSMFVTMTGFTTPGVIARYNFEEKDEAQRWSTYRTTLVSGLNPDDFKAEQVNTLSLLYLPYSEYEHSKQVWYPSKDGTKVPMFIVRHKSTQFDGTAPAIQYGACISSSMSVRQG